MVKILIALSACACLWGCGGSSTPDTPARSLEAMRAMPVDCSSGNDMAVGGDACSSRQPTTYSQATDGTANATANNPNL